MTPQRTALMTAGVAATMVTLSFAAVPFYSWFCEVTGFGGTPTRADAAPGAEDGARYITIRFEAEVGPDMPWEFHPVEREMQVKIGESGLAFYEATNTSDVPVAGSAAYNVQPYAAGGYFAKVDCFCFELQVLQPGETVQMPVSFFVDPAILDDPEAKDMPEITLGYTFYPAEMPEPETAALATETATGG